MYIKYSTRSEAPYQIHPCALTVTHRPETRTASGCCMLAGRAGRPCSLCEYAQASTIVSVIALMHALAICLLHSSLETGIHPPHDALEVSSMGIEEECLHGSERLRVCRLECVLSAGKSHTVRLSQTQACPSIKPTSSIVMDVEGLDSRSASFQLIAAVLFSKQAPTRQDY